MTENIVLTLIPERSDSCGWLFKFKSTPAVVDTLISSFTLKGFQFDVTLCTELPEPPPFSGEVKKIRLSLDRGFLTIASSPKTVSHFMSDITVIA